MATKFKYEVAISCLQVDEPIARQLYYLLHERVRPLFLWTQNQDEIAGKSGVEVFGPTYAEDSRVVVVLYRDGWGKSDWTGVEDRAVQHLYLKDWRRLLVCSMDGARPVWLNETYIWGNISYGLGVLAACIERKVQEEGGAVGEEDPRALAERLQRQRVAEERREARRSTPEAVEAARREAKAVYARLDESISSLAVSAPGLVRSAAIPGVTYTILTPEVFLGFRLEGMFTDSIRNASLTLHQSKGTLGPQGWTDESAHEIARYALELSEDEATWRWVERGKGVHFSSIELADNVLHRLLTEAEKRRTAARDEQERRQERARRQALREERRSWRR